MRLDLHRQRTPYIGRASTSASHTPNKSESGDPSQNFPYRVSPSPDSAQASPYQLFLPPAPGSASYHDHTTQYGANGSGANSSGEGSVGCSRLSGGTRRQELGKQVIPRALSRLGKDHVVNHSAVLFASILEHSATARYVAPDIVILAQEFEQVRQPHQSPTGTCFLCPYRPPISAVE